MFTLNGNRVSTSSFLAVALLLAALFSPLLAQETGFTKDFMLRFDDASNKVVELSGEIPADKYDWRPGEGVRSVIESQMHIAGANYFFGSKLGPAVPQGLQPREFEKTVKTKEEAKKTLDESIKFVSAAVKGVKDADMDVEVNLFGDFSLTKRGVILLIGDHMNEHLGQLIAYARINGVVPPWSQPKEGN